MSSVDFGDSKDCTDDKKLWLDYLARLRDRADRANQATGVTNWVLYGVMGTLLYKAMGLFPLAFSDSDYRYNTYIFAILGFNFLVLGQAVIREALPRMKGEASDIRAIPDKLQALLTAYFGFFAVFVVSLGFVELWLGYQNLHLTRFVRYVFFGFGAFHFVLGIAIGECFYIKRKLDGIREGMFPQFQGAALRGEWAMNTFVL